MQAMITILHCGESCNAEAFIIGKFAVSASGRVPLLAIKPSGRYIVSHIATGCTCSEIKGRDNAKRLARVLDRLLAEDFTTEDIVGEPSERYRAFCDAAKPHILRMRNS